MPGAVQPEYHAFPEPVEHDWRLAKRQLWGVGDSAVPQSCGSEKSHRRTESGEGLVPKSS